MPPIVSVIIPAYNRSFTIARAVESALAQTFQDLEVIVVDDGSSDTTRNIVQSIPDDRLRLICHATNLGAAAARNTGMKASQAKYIAWLDSDDEWLPEKLQTQLDAFQHAAPDVKACYSAHERIEQGCMRIHLPRQNDRKKLFLGCDLGPGTTLLFERTVLDEVGYLDESLVRYEDWDWLLRYCSRYRLVGVERPLARVYYTPRRSAHILEASAQIFVSKYSSELRQYGWLYRRMAISRRWMEVASYYAQEHNLKMIIKYVAKALFIYPFQPPDVWAWVINNWLGIKISSVFKGTN
jgi:glycosyltransferase involved in cell wall biosynthesis